MCDVCRVFSVICAFVLFSAAYCDDNNIDNDNATRTHSGRPNSGCLQQYHHRLVSRTALPRQYNYFHETLVPEQFNDDVKEDDLVDIQFRIVGGEQISIQEAPYQVLYGLYCGGVMIAPEWVMTAAHCKDKENFVLAGSNFISHVTMYPICTHFIHPLWRKSRLHTHDYDYQLVLLQTPIPWTLSSMPIAIGNEQDIQDGALVAVSGWGYIESEETSMVNLLRRVRVPVLNWNLCKSMDMHYYKNITKRMFCAGLLQGTKDACQGDSGGPAVINGKLVGLVSFGVGCARKRQPGVYSNVPHVRGWIQDVTGLPL